MKDSFFSVILDRLSSIPEIELDESAIEQSFLRGYSFTRTPFLDGELYIGIEPYHSINKFYSISFYPRDIKKSWVCSRMTGWTVGGIGERYVSYLIPENDHNKLDRCVEQLELVISLSVL